MPEQEKAKVGVFICHCGGNISKVIDVDELTEYIKTIDGVETADNHVFMCSEKGQELIRNKIAEHGLNRVVVASCSPKFHESTFRGTIQEAELNPYLLEMANIREQCSFPHQDEPEKATDKAKDLVRMAVARARLLEPLQKPSLDVIKNCLVIGAGIAGIQSALDLGDAGFKVYLVEKEPSIGGNMPKVVKTFPTDDCAMCTVSPKMNEVAAHENVEIFSYSEVKEVSGTIGNFNITIEKKARFVDDEKCVGCGNCMEKCPVKVPDEYNQCLGERPAAHISFPSAVPNIATIDAKSCLYQTKGKPKGKDVCKICVEACPADAIDHDQEPEEIKLNVGAIIVATGYKEYDASLKGNYGFGRYPNVITQMQLARMIDPNGPTKGRIMRPSDNKEPKEIVMVQCVGSRDDKPTGRPYCSRVCCMVALKHAKLLKRDIIKDCQIDICYIDIRSFGKGHEEYYRGVQDLGVRLTRGRPGEIIRGEDGNLIVRVEDTFTQTLREIDAELVVLSTATDPSDGTIEIANLLGIAKEATGFVREFHPKLKPCDTSLEGIFVAGGAQSPKDISDTVAQASGAAARACTILSNDKLELDAVLSFVVDENCDGCAYCIEPCPYDAISLIEYRENGGIKKTVEVNEAKCKGCGSCMATCPKAGIYVRHFKPEMFRAMVEAALQIT